MGVTGTTMDSINSNTQSQTDALELDGDSFKTHPLSRCNELGMTGGGGGKERVGYDEWKKGSRVEGGTEEKKNKKEG